jgi:chromosome partitioning protein
MTNITTIIGVVSQKGGVGKSTLARLIAREYAAAQWAVKIADMDTSQGTSYHWHSRRLKNQLEPEIAVEQFLRVDTALKLAPNYDLMIFDGAPHSTTTTLEIAKVSNLLILPTGLSLDDLEPTIRLAHELKSKGIPVDQISIALCRVGDSPNELAEARQYINKTNYHLLDGMLLERTGYRRASDTGRAATETTFSSLNEKAAELTQAIVNKLNQLKQKGNINDQAESHYRTATPKK